MMRQILVFALTLTVALWLPVIGGASALGPTTGVPGQAGVGEPKIKQASQPSAQLSALTKTQKPSVTAHKSSTILQRAQKRGHLLCGVSQATIGFSSIDKAGNWSGIEVDFCRALAAATLHSSDAVKFVPLSALTRIEALKTGKVDVLADSLHWTLGRDTNHGLRFVGTLFFESTALLVRREQNVTSSMELTGATFCILAGSSVRQEIDAYFGSRRMRHTIQAFEHWGKAVKAYHSKRCQVLAADATAIARQLAAMEDRDRHMILPEMIAQEPLGPVVLRGHENWFEIVRWTLFASIKSEELGLTRQNVDAKRALDNPTIRMFLGVDGEIGKALGLGRKWAYRIVKQVGNYGESFTRHLGQGSAIKMPRRLNKLWSDGGLLSAPPFR